MQVTISSKYQIVIPKPIRNHLNLKPKQRLTVIEKGGMLTLIPQPSIEELRGIAAGANIDDYREKSNRRKAAGALADPPRSPLGVTEEVF